MKVSSMKTQINSAPAIANGERVWFLKSMRRVRVLERHSDGHYTVEVIESGKTLTATREGLRRDDEVSIVLEEEVCQ